MINRPTEEVAVEFVPDHAGLAEIRLSAEESTVPLLADAILNDSQRFVPVLSGDLRGSGRIERHGSARRVVYGGGPDDVEYAVYQETGTSKMAAQPYLRPAAYIRRDLG